MEIAESSIKWVQREEVESLSLQAFIQLFFFPQGFVAMNYTHCVELIKGNIIPM